ncbi:MAG: pre-peptidase C-terminal domain-containing protein [Lacipirellulaceae bacterium]
MAFDIVNRWTNTQTDGAGINRGDAITLTWSFVPDGEDYSRALNSELIDYLDDGWNVAAIDRVPDLTNRPWWSVFETAYDQYNRVSGITLAYVAEQDSGGNDTGQFGDIRIGGAVIPETNSNILADNAFPNNGDMRIDTRRVNGNADFFHVNTPQLRNLVSHETGHGVGLGHSDIISGANAVMETPLESNFFALQFDDIYALNRSYGDPLEKNGGNDSFATASTLGSLSINDSVVIGTSADDAVVEQNDSDWVGLDGGNDIDWFRFTLTEPAAVNINLRPQGPTYETQQQGVFNAQAQSNLSFSLYSSGGNFLTAVDSQSIGEAEQLIGFTLPAAGDYLVRVDSLEDQNQFYELDIATTRQVTLQVNQSTGDLTLTSPVASVEIDAYTITSTAGRLDAANWQSLEDQQTAGWSEVPASSNLLGELQATGTTAVSPTSSFTIEQGYQTSLAGLPFGTSPERDVVFQYRNATTGETEQAIVVYVGDARENNLVLRIDPTTGDARITNESDTIINIDSYSVASDGEHLLIDWESLSDQQEAGWSEASPTAARLSELNPTGAMTLNPDDFFSLAGLWDIAGLEDISDLSFLFRDTTLGTFEGVIEFGTLTASFAADFDNDGDVDRDDLAQWRGDYGLNENSDANDDGLSNGLDFLSWQNEFGSGNSQVAASTSVPEPTASSLFLLLILIGAAGRRPSQRPNDIRQSTIV